MLAKFAAKYMKADKLAIVFGNTIHLYNTSRSEFLQNRRWLRHEVAHVHQWNEKGIIKFLCSYLLESFNKGYFNNGYEVEARKRETDPRVMDNIEIA